MKSSILLLAVFHQLILFQQISDRGPEYDIDSLKIVFAGDIMGHDSQIASAYDHSTKSYNYHTCFQYLKPYINQADIAVANLEVTLAGPPYKGYPRFSSPDELVEAIKETGFDILLNANNHALDRGKKGLERTIKVMDDNGLIFTGSFENKNLREKKYPLLVEKNNILLGILNFTYGTNGIIADTPNIVNYIDTTFILRDIEKLNKVNPDFIIATVHWGREYERTEHKSQEKLARFLFDRGVNVIIGAHPHVIQPIKTYPSSEDSMDYKLVAYSLGNFISNQRNRYRDGGILFEMVLTKTDKTRIVHYSYTPVWVHKPVRQSKTYFQLVPAGINTEQKQQFGFTKTDLDKLDQFYEDTRTHLKSIPENRFFKNHSFK